MKSAISSGNFTFHIAQHLRDTIVFTPLLCLPLPALPKIESASFLSSRRESASALVFFILLLPFRLQPQPGAPSSRTASPSAKASIARKRKRFPQPSAEAHHFRLPFPSGVGFRPAAYSASGSVKQNRLPTPSSLSTHICPRCDSTICFAIASPSPVPPESRDRALSTR